MAARKSAHAERRASENVTGRKTIAAVLKVLHADFMIVARPYFDSTSALLAGVIVLVIGF